MPGYDRIVGNRALIESSAFVDHRVGPTGRTASDTGHDRVLSDPESQPVVCLCGKW